VNAVLIADFMVARAERSTFRRGLPPVTTRKKNAKNPFIYVALRVAIVLLCTAVTRGEVRDFGIEIEATTQRQPAQVILNWRPLADNSAVVVSRKLKGENSWSRPANLPAGTTSFIDSDVVWGNAYEYQVQKSPIPNFGGTGYIFVGLDAPIIESRGKMILIVDNTYASDLTSELLRLQQDLIGDGWGVIRHDVSRTSTPPQVKALIQADYAADPQNVKSVFLFGHVPVAYSGNLNPDGHPEHLGAWPADVYYGDMDNDWTDSSVNSTSGARNENHNIPGDGKFDQSVLPSDVELQVGRVDLSNINSFAGKTELDLLSQYLEKDHNFRHGLTPMPRRALISDNFGEMQGEAFGASGYRNFSAFFGYQTTETVDGWKYFSTAETNAYLWTYACGGGSYNYCYYVGGTGDFDVHSPQSVFTMLLGSYFGDWDSQDNFLRGPLGGKYGLASMWAGRPHWFVHHLALGETLGYDTRITQNNRGLYGPQQFNRDIHIALMGDPSLRIHPVIPPSNMSATATAGGVQLNWTPSTDSNVQGYYIYRADSLAGPFTRISPESLISDSTFTDRQAGSGTFYMVRAVKLEQSASGTYFNPSQGIFATVVAGSPRPVTVALTAKELALGNLGITFQTELGKIYDIQCSSDFTQWTTISTAIGTGSAITFSDTINSGERLLVYRSVELN